jgi:hypothetical protein
MQAQVVRALGSPRPSRYELVRLARVHITSQDSHAACASPWLEKAMERENGERDSPAKERERGTSNLRMAVPVKALSNSMQGD